MTDGFIPFARPDYGDDESAALVRVLRSGWTTSGPEAAAFEREFCQSTGAAFALAVNSGTAAMHLALVGLEIGPGDEVITTPLTFCSTVLAILQAGATPVLADIGDDLNISPDAIERAITPRTKAILPVHLAGLPCNMDAIRSLSEQHGLRVIEDAAHAVGARYRGAPVGSGEFGAVAFSFYATKNLSTGEGGMVTTADAGLDARMRRLSLHGISRDAWSRAESAQDWFYDVVDGGFKANMSDLMAAIGRVQLCRLDAMNQRRAGIAAGYNEAFAGVRELELPPVSPACVHAWQLYILRLNLGRLRVDRAEFIRQMRERGVGSSVHFIPIPRHSYFQRTLELRDPCRRALEEYPRLVSIPLYPSLSDGEVDRVIAAVKETVHRNRR